MMDERDNLSQPGSSGGKGFGFLSDNEIYGRMQAPCHELKTVVWMKGVFWKTQSPGKAVVDTCASVFYTKERLMFSTKASSISSLQCWHCLFNETFLEDVEMFVRQIFNVRLDSFGEVNVQATVKVLLSDSEVIADRRKKQLWDAPRSLCLTHYFSAQISPFICNRFEMPHCMRWGGHFR